MPLGKYNYVIHDDKRICGFTGEYRFLSNFWYCPKGIWYEGDKFDSVEHAFQAAKFPTENRHLFKGGINSKEAKKLGKHATLPSNWESIKLDIMTQLVAQKFINDEELKKLLIYTLDKYIEETNSWSDVYWGVCNGKGCNMLGKILMGVRLMLIQIYGRPLIDIEDKKWLADNDEITQGPPENF